MMSFCETLWHFWRYYSINVVCPIVENKQGNNRLSSEITLEIFEAEQILNVRDLAHFQI